MTTDMAAHPTGNPRVRRVLVASPRSFCAGVERAIDTVAAALATAAGPVYVRHEIVHNTHVIADLAARGAIFVRELDGIPDPPPEGSVVIFSAHGVSPRVRAEAVRRQLTVIDATCPLVTKVHAEARRFAARGDTIVLIGHADHEEVRGTRGEAPGSVIVIDDAAAARDLRVADPDKVSYLTQTTLAVEETTQVIEALAARFPALSGPGTDDICYATTNRQVALAEVAAQADVVLVVGSAHSSNSVRLVELSDRAGTPAHLIDGPDDIDPAWLDDAETVGLTAGASAPPHLVDAVISRLRAVYGQQHHTEVIDISVGEEETVHFALPAPVRHHRPVDHGPSGKDESG